MAAVSILIGLVFYTASGANIGAMTQTQQSGNQTFTLPSAGQTSELSVCGQRAVTTVLTNRTSGATIPTNNYTISQSLGVDGYLAAKITSAAGPFAGTPVNVSCTFEPKGYISDGGSRTVTALIGIFMALIILACALPDTRNQVFDLFRR